MREWKKRSVEERLYGRSMRSTAGHIVIRKNRVLLRDQDQER